MCAANTRGSHICVACRSVCDRDQNGTKRSMFFFGADQGIKTNSERLVSTDQYTFLDTTEVWLRFVFWTPVKSSDQEPWNGAIKRSRTIFTDQDSWSQDQNGIKWSTFFLGVDQGIKTNSEQLISTDQRTFLDTTEAWLRFVLWNPVKSSDQGRFSLITILDRGSQTLLQGTCMWLPLVIRSRYRLHLCKPSVITTVKALRNVTEVVKTISPHEVQLL